MSRSLAARYVLDNILLARVTKIRDGVHGQRTHTDERHMQKLPGVRAVDNVSYGVRAGEVHALVGENGAGKSTLMKILSGVYTKDSGSIILNNEEVNITNVRDAQALGIVMIHQELNLMNHLTVAENIFFGREAKRSPESSWIRSGKKKQYRCMLD